MAAYRREHENTDASARQIGNNADTERCQQQSTNARYATQSNETNAYRSHGVSQLHAREMSAADRRYQNTVQSTMKGREMVMDNVLFHDK